MALFIVNIEYTSKLNVTYRKYDIIGCCWKIISGLYVNSTEFCKIDTQSDIQDFFFLISHKCKYFNPLLSIWTVTKYFIAGTKYNKKLLYLE